MTKGSPEAWHAKSLYEPADRSRGKSSGSSALPPAASATGSYPNWAKTDVAVLLAGANDVLTRRTPEEWWDDLAAILDGLAHPSVTTLPLAGARLK